MKAGTSQFRLLGERRFGPFFATQLAGAFNDSFLKQILILLVTFHGAEYSTLSAGMVTNLAAGLFILPFVLFSALAGQLADRYDKARVIRVVKLAEVGIMAVAALGFYSKSLPLLLIALFAMGCHSAFFGPVKYSILPRVLQKTELTGGNGLLEMGTFLSILAGTLAAGVLMGRTTHPLVLSLALTAIALLGLFSSFFIPSTDAAAPDLTVKFGLWRETADTVRMARREGIGVWNSLLAISWFWFIGAVVLSQIPVLGRDLLKGDASVVTVLLAVFSIGIGAGSLMCERLSERRVEIGLVPLGSLGLTLFTADLAGSAMHFMASASSLAAPLSWRGFLLSPGSVRILLDLGLLGVFGGVFIVPLYAFVQLRTAPERQSRIISANNILNALFMVIAAAMSAALLSVGVSVPGLILVCAGLNALVAVYIYRTVPEFLWRLVSWLLVHSVYRLRIEGQENLPAQGGALMAPNHVSYVDALVLSALSPRPIRFVMDAGIFRIPVCSWLFRQVQAIPIASRRDDPETLERAYSAIRQALDAGELVCVFPEGRLTTDGEIAEFKPGIRKMLDICPVPVIPVGMHGLWDSPFSRQGASPIRRLPRLRWGRRLVVRIGPEQPADIGLVDLRDQVIRLARSTD